MDVGALALNIDSASVVKATSDLDRFSASSERAAAASARVNFGSQSGSIARLAASVQSMDAKLSAVVGALDKANAALASMGKAGQSAAAANDNVARSLGAADSHVIAYTQHLAGLARAQQDANAHVLAYQANLSAARGPQEQLNAHVLAYRDSLNKVDEGSKIVSSSLKLTARDGLNLSRQFSDIGVTAAMGMNPLLIALQQGPQLIDIFQEKAIVAGTSMGAVFRAVAAEAAAMLLPFLPLIAAVGILVAALAALKSQANDDSGLKHYTTAMGYTKAEVAKLNAVTVTFGDTAKAVFQVGFDRIASALGISTERMASAWHTFTRFLVSAARAAAAGIYAAFTASFYAVKQMWDAAKKGEFLDPVSALGGGAKEAYGDAQKFMDDVVKQAQANAQKRQSDMAKAMFDAPHHRAATKRDPLVGILQGAQDEINSEITRRAAIGQSARAAEEMTQRTKLLNQIQKAGIPITDALRAKVDGLAKAYAAVKVAADTAAAIEGVTDGLQKQGDAINDQLALVGSYGDALTKARIEMDALAQARDALPKGETLSPEQVAKILGATKPVVADQVNLDLAQRAEAVRKDSEDAMYALDLERQGLGLTGAAAEAYAYSAERLNAAKKAGITLSSDEIAQINAAADAYGRARYAIDQQAQAIADAREVTKGFWLDWINGAREGKNIFKGFADAVVNSLNRIIDKLLDKGLNSLLDKMFSGGSGNALFGSIFGGGSRVVANTSAFAGADFSVLANAKGNVFPAGTLSDYSSSVVRTPTLFRFAKGAAVGEMGEAGPEAIMPLKRGANGKLGVQAHGGSGRPNVSISAPVYITQSGSFTTQDARAMALQAGQAAVEQVKKNLNSYIEEWQANGAVAV